MQIIDGKKIAEQILEDLAGKIKNEKIQPGLGVFLIGENKASELYVNLKKNAAEKIGIQFFLERFSESVNQAEIIAKIQEYNQNEKIHGIIVQLPLPEKFATQEIINAIDPKKDVDGFHPENKTLPAVFPEAMLELLKSTNEYVGKKAVVIANSETFGEKMCEVLEKEKIAAEYTLTPALSLGREKEILFKAEILISAVGKAGIIKKEMIKEGVIIIDGGITKIEDKVFGDADFDSVKEKTAFITPVPGGVGPVTIACLLRNVFLASKNN